MNLRLTLLFLILLAKPVPGFGQQSLGARFESLVAQAQQAQSAQDYAAAEVAYRQAVSIEPKMPELWANLGLMQQAAGEIAPAILSFQQANRLNPSLSVPNLFLGIDYLRTGKAQEAIPFLIKAEKASKSDPQAPLALGRAYFKIGKFSAAARELALATTLAPNSGAAWFALGIARLNEVEVDARRMSVEAKDSPFSAALYAESLDRQARFSEAAALYRSLIASQPQPPCIHSELGFSLLRHRNLAGAATEFATERIAHPGCGLALVGQARLAIENGENQQAATLIRELWDRDHGFVESNANLLLEDLPGDKAASVVAYFSQQSSAIPTELRSALLAALNGGGQGLAANIEARASDAPAAPQPASPRRTAEEYYAAGEFKLCAQRIDPQLDPAQPPAGADKLRLLAACSFFTGDDQRASSAAAALQALQPHSPEALYWSIQANERLALKSLARFEQLQSNSASGHVLLGDMYRQLERYDDAQAEYIKALALAPADPAALLGLASAYLSNNNIDKAADTAQSALARSPDDPDLNLIVAETMLSRHQYEQAEPYLLKSLQAKPQMLPRVHALLGKVYAETGRTKEAVVQLKLGASSDEDGTLQYLLARLYRQLGDSKDASEALDQMKIIKQERRDRGVKTIEDPDLTALEPPSAKASTP